MGRTYFHVGNKCREFDMNFSGAQLFGQLHAEAGAKHMKWTDALGDDEAEFKAKHPESWAFFSTKADLPGRMSRTDALASAAALDAMSERALIRFIKQHQRAWGGTQREFVEHVRSWIRFLRAARRGVNCF